MTKRVGEAPAPAKVPPPAPLPLDSVIISEFPAILGDFQKKQFSLLYRGSRDSFSASAFHARCNGRSNTLTVILDIDGNIFGGFTPLTWREFEDPWKGKDAAFGDDVKDERWQPDSSGQSFIFTLVNQHKVPPRKFALKNEMKHRAIWCEQGSGPRFGDDLSICDNADQVPYNSTQGFGTCYTNDTGLEGTKVFTHDEPWSGRFKVKEIEIFQIFH
jgi:hypothetical protein